MAHQTEEAQAPTWFVYGFACVTGVAWRQQSVGSCLFALIFRSSSSARVLVIPCKSRLFLRSSFEATSASLGTSHPNPAIVHVPVRHEVDVLIEDQRDVAGQLGFDGEQEQVEVVGWFEDGELTLTLPNNTILMGRFDGQSFSGNFVFDGHSKSCPFQFLTVGWASSPFESAPSSESPTKPGKEQLGLPLIAASPNERQLRGSSQLDRATEVPVEHNDGDQAAIGWLVTLYHRCVDLAREGGTAGSLHVGSHRGLLGLGRMEGTNLGI